MANPSGSQRVTTMGEAVPPIPQKQTPDLNKPQFIVAISFLPLPQAVRDAVEDEITQAGGTAETCPNCCSALIRSNVMLDRDEDRTLFIARFTDGRQAEAYFNRPDGTIAAIAKDGLAFMHSA